LRLIGILEPAELIGRNPYELFKILCDKTGNRVDPCMLDTFMLDTFMLDTFISITRFMDGETSQPWWAYMEERKANIKP
jgi:hypothetical protein